MKRGQFVRAFSSILGALALLASAGCGGGLKLYPVSGTVKLDGKPLTATRVSFNPDASKGNNQTVSCVGRLDGEGRFQIYTTTTKRSVGGPGAPLGWYRVTLVT